MATAKKAATVKRASVDPYVTTLLAKITVGKHALSFRKNEKVFSQGEPADSIYFIQTGRIKIAVVSSAGKEAVLAMPGPHEFFGEGSLVNQSLRISTAQTLEPSTVFRIEKRAMIRALHEQSELSEKFMGALLTRNIDLEEDLCDQLFNHSEKRLARVLLKLARLREHDVAAGCQDPRVESRDAGRNGGHHAVSNHPLHEQIQNNGTDRLQRRTHSKDRVVDRSGSARLS